MKITTRSSVRDFEIEENSTEKEKEDLGKSVTCMSGGEKRRGGEKEGRKQKSKRLLERGDEQMGTDGGGRKG